MKELSVFCYGEVGVDNIIQVDRLPTPEVAVFPQSESDHIGGAAANTSIWLANLGVKVGLSGNVIGDDAFGKVITSRLSKFTTLDLESLEIQPAVTTPFTRAIVTPDGERSFLIFYYPQTPKTEFSLEMLKNAGYLALDLYGGEERYQAAETAIKGGVQTTIGDVIWPDHKILPLTSIATNSGAYIQTEFPGVDIHQHAHKLQSNSKGIVVTTNGSNEVYTVDKEGNSFRVKPPQVDVHDATGAGDAFRAGLLFGLVCGYDLQRSVCYGVACGSLKVQNWGAATTLPTLEEVRSLADTLIVF